MKDQNQNIASDNDSHSFAHLFDLFAALMFSLGIMGLILLYAFFWSTLGPSHIPVGIVLTFLIICGLGLWWCYYQLAEHGASRYRPHRLWLLTLGYNAGVILVMFVLIYWLHALIFWCVIPFPALGSWFALNAYAASQPATDHIDQGVNTNESTELAP